MRGESAMRVLGRRGVEEVLGTLCEVESQLDLSFWGLFLADMLLFI